jgi:S-adenosylmethionine decarboxylase
VFHVAAPMAWPGCAYRYNEWLPEVWKGFSLMSAEPGAVDPASADEMCSYAIDVWVKDPAILTDEKAMVAIMREAAESGHALVLGECSYTFANGAMTAVLILSQSHLSVHTWPEHSLANFDLLTCGRLNGEMMIAYLEKAFDHSRVNITRVIRDVHGPGETP